MIAGLLPSGVVIHVLRLFQGGVEMAADDV